MTQFADLGLSRDLLKVLPELGIETPSEIQEKAIPLLLNDYSDFIGMAQTGTGKTAAFGLPLIDSINLKNKGIQGIVLAPTRELGLQISEQLKKFSKYIKGLNVVTVYGGANIVQQMKELKRTTHIVVATPGRLIDLLNRKALSLDELRVAVLDEADEMLNMGFRDDIDFILSKSPKERATWLFSATMSKDIRKIVTSYMENPGEVKIDPKRVVNERIKHQVLKTSGERNAKRSALKQYLDVSENIRAVVFCRTKAETKDVSDELRGQGYSIDAINGDMSQNTRERVMQKFKTHQLDVLVATDVAARGIDVNDLTHVFHFNIPDDIEYYTHRSGRTARAGKSGFSIVFARNAEFKRVKFLQKSLNIDFEEISLPSKKEIVTSKLQELAINFAANQLEEGVPEVIVDAFAENLSELSKEELVEKIIANELSRMGFSYKEYEEQQRIRKEKRKEDRKERGDRNDRRDRDRGGRDSRSDRRDRGDRGRNREDRERGRERSSSDYVRFSMNVGRKDEIDKRDLIDFISSQSNIKKRAIGNIEMKDKTTFVEIPQDQSKGFTRYFEEIEVNGRDLKVKQE